MIEPLYKRMTPQDAERLKRRCKEYFYYWLKFGEPYYLVSYKTHYNLLNKYLEVHG
ncbi:MAG: hypothetical protein J6S67_05005 [Methanobrevibacter sp.]|nr:hypothetical protein [Methanobrevibacter sp.]